MKIGVFAFAGSAIFYREVIALAQARDEDIEWSAIIPAAPFRSHFDGVVARDKTLYLYERFNEVFAASRQEPQLSSSANNINLILATDKNGYRNERKDFQYRWAAAMIAIMRAFLEHVRPDYMLFPAIETVEGSLLANICQEMGVGILNAAHMRSIGLSFFSTDQFETLPAYFGSFDHDALARAGTFLDSLGGNVPDAVRYPPLAKTGDKVVYRPPHILFRFLRSLRDAVGRERHARHEGGLRLQITRNLVRPLNALRRLRYRVLDHRLFDVTTSRGSLPPRYILYASQVTPEQSINSLAQFYIEQERAIDLLRMYAPHGYAIVVKEHPAMVGRRPRSHYMNLRRMPGVVLVSPEVSTAQVVKQANLIATVSGTIGLECWLLDRPCLMFGTNFFKHLCYAADAVEGLKAKLAAIIEGYRPPEAGQKRAELAKIYNIGYPFVLFEPLTDPYTLERTNIANYLDAVLSHIERIRNSSPETPRGRDAQELENRRYEILQPLRNT